MDAKGILVYAINLKFYIYRRLFKTSSTLVKERKKERKKEKKESLNIFLNFIWNLFVRLPFPSLPV